MKYNFCTLFDRNYIYKGLALHTSLLHHRPDFHLWILCMDDITFNILEKLKLEKASLIRIDEFEDDAELLLQFFGYGKELASGLEVILDAKLVGNGHCVQSEPFHPFFFGRSITFE